METLAESPNPLSKRNLPKFPNTDVVWVGQEIEKLGNKGADPFDGFKFIFGKGAFDGKRLKFLRDAYMNGRIYPDQDAMLYLRAHWADANGLQEMDLPFDKSNEERTKRCARN